MSGLYALYPTKRPWSCIRVSKGAKIFRSNFCLHNDPNFFPCILTCNMTLFRTMFDLWTLSRGRGCVKEQNISKGAKICRSNFCLHNDPNFFPCILTCNMTLFRTMFDLWTLSRGRGCVKEQNISKGAKICRSNFCLHNDLNFFPCILICNMTLFRTMFDLLTLSRGRGCVKEQNISKGAKICRSNFCLHNDLNFFPCILLCNMTLFRTMFDLLTLSRGRECVKEKHIGWHVIECVRRLRPVCPAYVDCTPCVH